MPNAFGRPDRDILYTCGPIARSVADAAAMLDVMAGLDVGRPHWAPPPARPYHATLAVPDRPLRVRFSTRAPLGPTHPEVAAAVTGAARLLGELGHHVEEAPLPAGSLEEFLPLWQHLVGDIPLARFSRAQPITRWLGEAGKLLRREDMVSLRRQIAERLLRELGDAEIWLTPTVGVPAPRVGSFLAGPPGEAFAAAAPLGSFTAMFNVTGQPAASVPLGLTREGLPMGLQVAGRPLREDDVLAVSLQLEQTAPWRARVAPLPT